MSKILYSFDVFDTTITRKTATPTGIFDIMGEYLCKNSRFRELPMSFRQNFVQYRKSAEQRARFLFCDHEQQEVTLEQIYETMLHTGQLNRTQIEILQQLEVWTEEQNVIKVAAVVDKIVKLKERGERVIFISDMYLSRETICRLLVTADNRLAQIPVYVSSEYGKNKYSGELFKVIQRIEQVDFDNWIHCGDNGRSDCEIPEVMGIRTERLCEKKLLPMEEHTLDAFCGKSAVQCLIGRSANARFFSQRNCTDAFAYGTSLVSPMILGYISWILEEAERREIRTLYFVARDGFLLKMAADRWIACRHLSIETKYLYGSRQAWRFAALDEENWDIPLWVRWSRSTNDFTKKNLARIFAMTENQIQKFLPPRFQKKNYFSETEIKEIAEILGKDSVFKSEMLRNHAPERTDVIAYLKENINMDERYAFVEWIGSGFTQIMLAELMRKAGADPILTFFYHMDAWMDDEHCRFLCYQLSRNRGTALTEVLMSAPHGRTTGYRRTDDGSVVPVLNDESVELDKYGMREFRSGFRAFLDLLDGTEDISLAFQECCLDYMANKPDGKLLAFIGDIPFGVSGRTGDIKRYAPHLGIPELRRIYYERTLEPIGMAFCGVNINYALKRCTPEEKDYIRYCEEFQFENAENDYGISFGRISLPDSEKRIAIYGAGKLGKKIVTALRRNQNRQIALWVDRKLHGQKIGGVDIYPVERCLDTKYDILIVAIGDRWMAELVRSQLIKMGVLKRKIVLKQELEISYED